MPDPQLATLVAAVRAGEGGAVGALADWLVDRGDARAAQARAAADPGCYWSPEVVLAFFPECPPPEKYADPLAPAEGPRWQAGGLS